MKRLLLSLLMLAALTSLYAQRQKATKPELPQISVEEAIAKYDFATAELLLKEEIATLKKKRQPTLEQEERIQWLHKAQIKLNAVERVMFIDSIIVPRNEAIKHIHLSPECGSLFKYTDFFGGNDEMGCTGFKSQMGDQIIYAQPDTAENLKLFMRDIYSDDTMSPPTMLKGISDNEDSQNNPFMMDDGTTFYFAAQGPESLGGYDIFMSRYDIDEHCFLVPENIGMPFNSPANDYLYAIDEFYNLGWFVTDRNMPEDSVCIYIFIPNETRQVYIPEEIGDSALRNLARISSIRDTWGNDKEIYAAQLRLRELRKERGETLTGGFDFIVTGNQVYHKKDDFHNPQAQQLSVVWNANQTELRRVRDMLKQKRAKYHQANQAERQNMQAEILTLEKREMELHSLTQQQERQIRNVELGL